jgi:DtxR family Mn-dependent transcriptional regulator
MQETIQHLTENEARYLKLIYRAFEEARQLGTTDIARSLGIRPASVTEVLQTLHSKGLVLYRRYRKVEITELGIKTARKLLRRHRVLEVHFANILKCGPEEACAEASRLDFHISDRAINAICRTYGHPNFCPCGKPVFPGPDCRSERSGNPKPHSHRDIEEGGRP